MRRTSVLTVGVLAISLWTSLAIAQPDTHGLAMRTELHPINTLTLSDQQFLTGNADGQPITITGELRIASGSGRLPVVILQHGSGGMGANVETWAREFNAMGVSTFALDGF